jgi:hypothetical protein
MVEMVAAVETVAVQRVHLPVAVMLAVLVR